MTTRNTRFRELIYNDIENRRLRVALNRIRAFSKETALSEVYEESVRLEKRYYYMLRFMTGGNPDPNQGEEISKMLEQALELAERAYILSNRTQDDSLYHSAGRYASIRKKVEDIPSLSVDYINEHTSLMANPEALLDTGKRQELERLSKELFNRIWVDFPLNEESREAILNLILTKDIPLADRVAWTNALMLGSLENYDPTRILLLAELTSSSNIPDIQASAMSGIFFFLHKNQNKNLSPTFYNAIEKYFKDSVFSQRMKTVIFEYAREMGTFKIARSIEEDVIPKLNSLGSEFQRKISEIDLKTKSPEEVQDIIESLRVDSPSTNLHLRDLNEMAEEGDDVFFAFMKQIHQMPFFNELSNWWLPFDPTRSELKDIFEDEGALLGELFEELYFLCDSDKYAVLTAVATSPANMRKQTMEMMVSQYRMIAEHLPKPEAGKEAEFRMAVSNYMKNAFRFYQLFNRREEFYNPFLAKIGFNSSGLLAGLYNNIEEIQAIADRLYDSNIKPFAYPFYSSILSHENNPTEKLILRAADCAESAGFSKNAIELLLYYLYEIKPDEAILHKLISVNNSASKSLDFIEIIEKCGGIEIENLDILYYYALKLSEKGNYSQASDVTDKIIYQGNDEDIIKAKILKAGILLVDGNPLGSIDILAELPQNAKKMIMPYIISGIAYLVSNEPEQSFSEFKKALEIDNKEKSYNFIENQITSYAPKLIDIYGITLEDLNAMLDALKYSLTDNMM